MNERKSLKRKRWNLKNSWHKLKTLPLRKWKCACMPRLPNQMISVPDVFWELEFSANFHLYRREKSIVKNWFHVLPNPSHFRANAQWFGTAMHCASSQLEEVLEYAVPCLAEYHPIQDLGTGQTEKWHLAFWWSEQCPFWIWKTVYQTIALLFRGSLFADCVSLLKCQLNFHIYIPVFFSPHNF